MSNLYRTKPAEARYVKAIMDGENVSYRLSDRNGKEHGPIVQVPQTQFLKDFEPARRATNNNKKDEKVNA